MIHHLFATRCLLAALLLLGAQAVTPSFAQGQARRWSSAQGGSIEAELIEIGRDQVTLKRTDGSGTISISLARLSDADRSYVTREWAAQRMSGIILPEVSFRDESLQSALRFLEETSCSLCKTTPRLWFKLDASVTNAPTLTLLLRKVPLSEALKVIADLTSTKIVVEGSTVTVTAPPLAEDPAAAPQPATAFARVRYTIQVWELSAQDSAKLKPLLTKDGSPAAAVPNPSMRQALALFDSIRKASVATFQKTVNTGEPVQEKKRSGTFELDLSCAFELLPPNVIRLTSELAIQAGKRSSTLTTSLPFFDNERCLSLSDGAAPTQNAFAKCYALTATAQLVDPYGRPVRAVAKAAP